jgi:ADP-dependent NAD(P)H-hydrate dehydratase / NAD(P)H-hydrate epimerase
MLILSARQIRDWDLYTIQNEPIASIDLMEAAAIRCFQWLHQNNFGLGSFHIFCGKGNNGGDGLAVARMLCVAGAKVAVYVLEPGQAGTDDFQINLARLHDTNAAIHYVQKPENFPVISTGDTVIDALFGTGLNRKLEGVTALLVDYINSFPNPVIAIDLPSGMLADDSSMGFPVVKATHTLSFQCLKLAFMMAENEAYTGQVHVLDIGLLRNYMSKLTYQAMLVEADTIKAMYQPRQRFSHKGSFGHAALIAGSYGFMGAATLAANACLRSGAGKLTVHVPACGYEIMQLAVPEAMTRVEEGTKYIKSINDFEKYSSIGMGPGLGLAAKHKELLEVIFSAYKKPMVIDADSLNVLSKIHPFSVLTPHPAEFDRMFGKSENDFARMRMALQKAKELQLIIILKGHRTFIAQPGGNSFFNSTGNPGMATGGSGDVLTGILTGLLARGYPPEQTALMGVYLHGLAGDYAAAALTEEAMLASDITRYLSSAFHWLKSRDL